MMQIDVPVALAAGRAPANVARHGVHERRAALLLREVLATRLVDQRSLGLFPAGWVVGHRRGHGKGE